MSSLFGGGGGSTVIQAPTPLPPPTMPDPSSPENIAAGQAQARKDAARAGRASTILTQPNTRTSTIAGGALGSKPAAPAASTGTPATTFASSSL